MATPSVVPSASTVPASSPSASARPVDAPSELRVACDGTQTIVLTPIVRAQADGIHVHFDNTSGRDLTFEIEDASGVTSEPIAVGGAGFVLTFVPGSYDVSCGGAKAPFEALDPAGLYISDALPCVGGTTGSLDYGPDARGPRGSLLDIARLELHGLRPGDLVEHAGYPRGAGDQRVRVVRGGQLMAAIGYMADGHGGWLLSGTRTCPGTDITAVAPDG